MNKQLMERLYEQVGEDLKQLFNSDQGASYKLIGYKFNWKTPATDSIAISMRYYSLERYNDEFILAEINSEVDLGINSWRLVCTVDEYKEFCKTKQQPIDEEVIYTIDFTHPVAHTTKVYDFLGNEITKVVKVEWTKDTTYVTILSENTALGDKDSVAHFRGEVKGAKVVIQQRGEKQ